MKKTVLFAALALGAMTASAQAVEQPKFFDNFSIGVDGGVTTPMIHSPFWKAMRGTVGLNISKQVTPTFGVGVESAFGINTSTRAGRVHSSTAFDDAYVGVYGAVDLFNLFGGYNCGRRVFTIEAQAGAGWGHYFQNSGGPRTAEQYKDRNFFATKAGLNFNFNVSDHVTIAVKPSVMFNMTDGNYEQSTAAYDKHYATFNLVAGLTYHFGGGFQCVQPYNQAEVDALNAQINDLRAQLDACAATALAWETKANGLAADLQNCMNRKPEVVKEVSNNLNSVRYIFFRLSSAVITADQQPNVEMIAQYMKKHPNSKVVIKGYASPEGNLDFNIKLAQRRAESVKNELVKRYKIAADRITAEGQGIGEMFTEPSWNRVSICTIEDAK